MNEGLIERSTIDPSDFKVKVSRRLKFTKDAAEFYTAENSLMLIPALREFVLNENGKLYRIDKNMFEENPVWKKYEYIGENPQNPLNMSVLQILGSHNYGIGIDMYAGTCVFTDYKYENGLYVKSGVLGEVQGMNVPSLQYKIEIKIKNKKLYNLKIVNESAPTLNLIGEVKIDYAKPTINVPTDWVWENAA